MKMHKGSCNSVTIIGRVGADPKAESKNGFNWCRISLATSSSKKVGEKWQDETTWHSIFITGKQAETATKFLKKGSLVMVDGHLTNKKDTKTGNWQVSIVCDNFTMLGNTEKKAESQPAAAPAIDLSGDDDLPF